MYFYYVFCWQLYLIRVFLVVSVIDRIHSKSQWFFSLKCEHRLFLRKTIVWCEFECSISLLVLLQQSIPYNVRYFAGTRSKQKRWLSYNNYWSANRSRISYSSDFLRPCFIGTSKLLYSTKLSVERSAVAIAGFMEMAHRWLSPRFVSCVREER